VALRPPVLHLREDRIEAAIALLGQLAMALDPLRHMVDEMLRHRLEADVVQLRQLADADLPAGQPGHHVSAHGVGQRGEGL
jgi:hypothetical protein